MGGELDYVWFYISIRYINKAFHFFSNHKDSSDLIVLGWHQEQRTFTPDADRTLVW